MTWEALDSNRAQVTIRKGDLAQTVTLTVADDGQPVLVEFPRWSNANPEKVFKLQPFGGHLAKFREIEGYRLPTRIEAGNFFGTDDYFPFFIADVREFRFPSPE